MIEWLVPVLGFWWLHRQGYTDFDFNLRNALRWQRGTPLLPAEPKTNLFTKPGTAEAERLITTYHLTEWAAVSGRTDFATSLVYAQILERAFGAVNAQLGPSIRVVDVGPSDWFYVRALHAVLRRYDAEDQPRHVELDGVEFDAYRIYSDMRSRFDWAKAYVGDLEFAHYEAGDARHYTKAVDVALMFYPFLFLPDHVRWGLPRWHMRPAELLQHVASLVKPGGLLVIVNQGGPEMQAQHKLLAEIGLEPTWWAAHATALWEYDPPRFVTVYVKPKT